MFEKCERVKGERKNVSVRWKKLGNGEKVGEREHTRSNYSAVLVTN